ncbi:serine/threonine-protein kinase [Yinghuangia seranimata]|uniref:serine/threonine-protein kinase n=1 Tax=Yinghuangia seranimata TaxID=408067 RepID=UPI00248D3298|nr:serine/threonine-protein kinase [Yinghuangia seranimata]MDI2125927.1 serine/threonine-protein kinase [Yinghuangia seranimata]
MQPLEASDPERIGSYRLTGRLGAGGMGLVYQGRSPSGRMVAIKVVRPDLAGDEEFRVRFAREVAAARRVGGFYTAPVVDADTDGPLPWLATAYLPGPSLQAAVRDHGPLPEPSLRVLTAGLAEGLQSIHATGLVHRDLKPSNVLLALDGPRVIDFGIARAADETSVTATGLVVGSPGFLSPEQANDHEVGPPSDVFSLASVVVFAATGAGPFGGGSVPGLLFRVVHNPPSLDGVPEGLRDLLSRCLAKDPAARPRAGQVLAEALAPGDATAVRGPRGWLPEPVAAAVAAATAEWGYGEPGRAADAASVSASGLASGPASGPAARPAARPADAGAPSVPSSQPSSGPADAVPVSGPADAAPGSGQPDAVPSIPGPPTLPPPPSVFDSAPHSPVPTPPPSPAPYLPTMPRHPAGPPPMPASPPVQGTPPAQQGPPPAAVWQPPTPGPQPGIPQPPSSQPPNVGQPHAPQPGFPPPGIPGPPVPEPRPGVSRRRFIAIGSAAATVAAGGGIAAWLLGRSDGGDGAKNSSSEKISSPNPPGPTTNPPPVAPAPKPSGPYTLTWLTESFGDPSDTDVKSAMDGLNSDVGKLSPSGKLTYTLSPFDQLEAKRTNMLAAGAALDLFDVQASQLAQFAEAGQLADLTPYQELFHVDSWIPGLRDACTYNGKLVAVPIGNSIPVVVYRKDLCDPAGFTVPKTQDDWLAGLEKVRAKNTGTPGFQAILLPGQAWQVISSCVWAAGGQIAERVGGRWKGQLDTPEALTGIRFFQKLQGYSTALKTDTDYMVNNPPNQILAKQATGMAVASDWLYDTVVSDDPTMAAKLGAFPLPGPQAGIPAPVGSTGTLLCVSAKSQSVAGAAQLLALALADRFQASWGKAAGLLPARKGLPSDRSAKNPMVKAGMEVADLATRAYPTASGWTVQPLRTFATNVLQGMDPATAAAQANALIDQKFNESKPST